MQTPTVSLFINGRWTSGKLPLVQRLGAEKRYVVAFTRAFKRVKMIIVITSQFTCCAPAPAAAAAGALAQQQTPPTTATRGPLSSVTSGGLQSPLQLVLLDPESAPPPIANVSTGPDEGTVKSGTPNYLVNLVAILTVHDGYWGDWKMPTPYPNLYEGRALTGFQLRSEPPQGTGDDTALNGLRIRCSFGPSMLSVTDGLWGAWYPSSSIISCPSNTYIIGARMQVEPKQGSSGDDTAANAIEFMCGSITTVPTEIRVNSLPTSWGAWTPWVQCPLGTRVCGAQARFESSQVSYMH
ncbi:hypothetical protein VOLCADRAFT_87734 [Volvox carteri f. nagariensis]|uniref:Vitelline membrane outer layer protein 1 n=1 Tax=Volvox carteri f. nagariensis TaxID=3068 RepID=D8TM39_VOLCA|nr:uncharacterized protein VOLCADRAFT_87734 [Volvox carteri f. nagariensis]EFJ51438.1 hypothetical protein VOLCADRAFT_87734 [Volvox carteri f. nagariensis]|eukprot:XP_002947390.1 hypothetical protein VOLCADRAFT_87734 [Volvox carteri f. nagariensis]